MVEKTDFLAGGNHFFSPFFKDYCQFFSVYYKSIFQQKSSFRLVKTDFLARGNCFRLLGVFLLSGNCH